MSFPLTRAFVQKLTQQTGPECELTQLASDYNWCHSEWKFILKNPKKKNQTNNKTIFIYWHAKRKSQWLWITGYVVHAHPYWFDYLFFKNCYLKLAERAWCLAFHISYVVNLKIDVCYSMVGVSFFLETVSLFFFNIFIFYCWKKFNNKLCKLVYGSPQNYC